MSVYFLLLGHGGHGKDSVAEIWNKHFQIPYKGSSFAAAEKIIWPIMEPFGIYKNIDECYSDRRNHRQLWKTLISGYNADDAARLAIEIYKDVPVYVGMRAMREFEATLARFNPFIIWVDASERCPPDPSMEIPKSVAHLVIDNNGPEEDLPKRAVEAFTQALAEAGELHAGT